MTIASSGVHGISRVYILPGETCGANLSPPPPIMEFNKQDRECIITLSAVSRSPERSEGEGSLWMGTEMLRFAQHDNSGFGR